MEHLRAFSLNHHVLLSGPSRTFALPTVPDSFLSISLSPFSQWATNGASFSYPHPPIPPPPSPLSLVASHHNRRLFRHWRSTRQPPLLQARKVYFAARSENKALRTIASIKAQCPDLGGQLVHLHLDLADLSTIKASAEAFLAKNTRLDIVFNNAGVLVPPQGSKTAQGHELQLGTNCLGLFLFTKLLRPMLAVTAKTAATSSVRVVWVSSNSAKISSPQNGIDMTNLDYHIDKNAATKCGTSKASDIFHSSESARRYGGEGINSVSLMSGALKSDLNRHMLKLVQILLLWTLQKDPIFGAHTEAFAGLSPKVDQGRNGVYIVPWGRFYYDMRKDLVLAMAAEEGGTRLAKRFWEWSEEQVEAFVVF